MDLSLFHPLIARWFAARFGEPTAPQVQGWAHIAEGRDTLVAAPTGSGKTLAAFLWSINHLVAAAHNGTLRDETAVVYVSPLKPWATTSRRTCRNRWPQFPHWRSRPAPHCRRSGPWCARATRPRGGGTSWSAARPTS